MQFRAQRDGYGREFPDADDWVVVVDGEPVGRLLVDRRPGMHHLVDIAVMGGRRGRGIGTALLRASRPRPPRLGFR